MIPHKVEDGMEVSLEIIVKNNTETRFNSLFWTERRALQLGHQIRFYLNFWGQAAFWNTCFHLKSRLKIEEFDTNLAAAILGREEKWSWSPPIFTG